VPSVPAVPPFTGAVLCGGASRRMGRDKAFIPVGGRTLVRRVADALEAAGATPVVAVGGDLAALRAEGLTAVPDDAPGAGPLAGIVTALGPGRDRATTLDTLDTRVAPDAPDVPDPPEGPGGADTSSGADATRPLDDPGIVFVAGCDLIDPSPEAIRATVAALADDATADVAVPVVGGRRQWVHAAWRRGVRAPLAAALAAGERAVHAAVAVGSLRVVEVGLDPRAVADADVPADLGRVAGAGPPALAPGARPSARRGGSGGGRADGRAQPSG
jgi:molybdenum cofactor guanylyltransferase